MTGGDGRCANATGSRQGEVGAIAGFVHRWSAAIIAATLDGGCGQSPVLVRLIGVHSAPGQIGAT